MSHPQRRSFLGRCGNIGGQQRVYRASEYIEIDNVEGFDVARRRIFYDEIVLVTLHASRNWLLLVSAGTAAAILTLIATALSTSERSAAAVVFLGALPFIAVFVWHLAVPLQKVTVFGKRMRAEMAFWTRPGRARDAYLTVCRLARDRQTRLAREQGLRLPAGLPGLPPGTPEPPPPAAGS